MSQNSLIESLKTTALPPVLYHYTDQRGFLGILGANQLRASAVDYLNDASEYSYGLRLIRHALRKRSKDSHTSDEREKLAELAGGIWRFTTVCVACLTTEGDQLSQWRAYAGGAGGVSIGIKPENLRVQAHRQGFYLTNCVYDRKEQRREVEHLVDEFVATIRNFSDWNKCLGNCTALSTRMAVKLKHPSFEEEQEWRLISMPQMINHMEFREGKSALVPYFNFSLGSSPNEYLECVRLGPTPAPKIARESVGQFLFKIGVAHGAQKIKLTRIPYRTW